MKNRRASLPPVMTRIGFRAVRITALLVVVSVAVLTGIRHGPARADAPPGRYKSLDCSGTPCVLDNSTGLTWMASEDGGIYDWSTASTKCVSPWRLPTIRELQSIVDETQILPTPTIDTSFFSSSGGGVWSSTPTVGLPDYQWGTSFHDGNMNTYFASTMQAVRCVQ